MLSIEFDGALPGDTPEQTLDLAGFPPNEPASGVVSRAIIQLTPRDPGENGYTTKSGSVTISATHGVARGQIDGTFPPLPGWPVKIAGTFACNH